MDIFDPQREAERRIAEAAETNATHLDLAFLYLKALPSQLRDLSTLLSLNVRGNVLGELPSWLGELGQLQSLDVSGNGLGELPSWLGELRALQSLDVSYNVLGELPSWLGELRALQSLDVSENGLGKLPSWLGELRALQSLNVSGNELGELPSWLGELRELQSLDVSNNVLGELPSWLGELRALQSLDVSRNWFGRLPPSLVNLGRLQLLNVSENGLGELPSWLGELRALQSLDVSENGLGKLPSWLGELRALQSLNVSGNELGELPSWLGELRELQSLDVSNNVLGELPSWLGELRALQSLDVSRNWFGRLPPSLVNLGRLQLLNVSENGLGELPSWLGELGQLQSLDVSGNGLVELPSWLGELRQLQSLNLANIGLNKLPRWLSGMGELRELIASYNGLRRLPSWLGEIRRIEWIDVRGNKLTELPSWLALLPSLRHIFSSGNEITEPPPEIVQGGIAAIRRYYRQARANKTVPLYEAKLLIVGAGGAGKTSLAKKLIDPEYVLKEEGTENEERSTEGIDILTWTFPREGNGTFDANIWDFGGQEIYHATHQYFLTKRSLYVLVVDMRREDTDFGYWLEIVNLLSDGSPLLIVQNQRQGRNTWTLPISQYRGHFSNVGEVLTTDLSTNRGLDVIASEIRHRLQQLPHVGTGLPATWVEVRKTLETLSKEKPHISLDAFLDLCRRHGFDDEQDIRQLSGYLHDLGICLHFQEDALLDELVILQPEWGTDAAYKVLDSERVKEHQGRFMKGDLDEIWSAQTYRRKRSQLLRLMLNFKLCYEVPGESGSYVAPQLLPEEKPDYTWDEADNLHLRYTYKFMPKGLAQQLIVREHRWIADHRQRVWRYGVVLAKEDAEVEVTEDWRSRCLNLRAKGPDRRDLLIGVMHALDDIHERYERLHFEKEIPCFCEECQREEQPHFFAYRQLWKFVRKGKSEAQCGNGTMVEIGQLLDAVGESVHRGYNPISGSVIEREVHYRGHLVRHRLPANRRPTSGNVASPAQAAKISEPKTEEEHQPEMRSWWQTWENKSLFAGAAAIILSGVFWLLPSVTAKAILGLGVGVGVVVLLRDPERRYWRGFSGCVAGLIGLNLLPGLEVLVQDTKAEQLFEAVLSPTPSIALSVCLTVVALGLLVADFKAREGQA